MRKKYIVSLAIITIMFFLVLCIGTGYGLWVATKQKSNYNTKTLDCFKAYFSNGENIEMLNIDPITNEEGQDTSPYTLTITNICDSQKELQVHLNILAESTVDTNSLTIQAAGNINLPTTLYKNLSNTKVKQENVTESKLIGLISVKPNETVRTNVKIWFDERKAPNMPRDSFFKAKFDLIDTESTIKPTLGNIIVADKNQIEEKGSPSFNIVSTTEEGLYVTTKNNIKTYYYRGVINNNYVYFANLLWRIVSVSENNTIKLILDKSAMYQPYNFTNNYKDYTGFSYIFNDALVYANIKSQLTTWYNDTIIAQDLDKYIVESEFCNDSNYTFAENQAYFFGYTRLTTSSPDLTCQDTTSDFGGKYNQKVGLITADEIIMAGGSLDSANYSYYLYNGEGYFTMTPAKFEYNVASVFTVNNDGLLSFQPTTATFGVRPVINISSNVTITGTGTLEDPYIIDEYEE